MSEIMCELTERPHGCETHSRVGADGFSARVAPVLVLLEPCLCSATATTFAFFGRGAPMQPLRF